MPNQLPSSEERWAEFGIYDEPDTLPDFYDEILVCERCGISWIISEVVDNELYCLDEECKGFIGDKFQGVLDDLQKDADMRREEAAKRQRIQAWMNAQDGEWTEDVGRPTDDVWEENDGSGSPEWE